MLGSHYQQPALAPQTHGPMFHYRPGEADKCAQSPLTLGVKRLYGTPGLVNTQKPQVRGPSPTGNR